MFVLESFYATFMLFILFATDFFFKMGYCETVFHMLQNEVPLPL